MCKIKNKNIYEILFFLLILSMCFSAFSFNIGFSFKPYMFCILTFSVFLIENIKKIKLTTVDYIFLIFILISTISMIFGQDLLNSLKYVVALIIMEITYFVTYQLLINIDKEKIVKIITKIGIIFVIITIIYYLMGVFSLSFNFHGNGEIKYGVLLDRNIARLISPASSDPNITVFYLAFFLYFFIYNFKNKKNILGIILTSICIVLTFSRGGYIAVLTSLMVYLYFKNDKKFIVVLKTSSVIALIFALVAVFIPNTITNVIIDRFMSTVTDGGAGRVSLWKNAISTFFSYPVLGIGLNNTLNYSLFHYRIVALVHNTLLEVLSETGIFGLITYFTYLFFIIKRTFILSKETKNYAIFSLNVCLYVQMLFLSLLTEEVFFIFLAIISVLFTYEVKEERYLNEN